MNRLAGLYCGWPHITRTVERVKRALNPDRQRLRGTGEHVDVRPGVADVDGTSPEARQLLSFDRVHFASEFLEGACGSGPEPP